MVLIGPDTIALTLLIGLVAGAVGGLAGIGGSIIMLPALGILLAATPEKSEQHLYQAAAMCVNVVVAWSSSRRHQEAGVHDPQLRRWLLPGLVGGIIVGVLISEQLRGDWLRTGLVVFLWVYCIYNVVTVVVDAARKRARAKTPDTSNSVDQNPQTPAKTGMGRIGVIGALTGVPSGILGIGGGIVMVPLMQMWGRVDLRRAIAASASVMWISAMIGAGLKVYGLPQHGEERLDALALAAPMALGAFLGSRIGAGLTHKLKLPHLKLAISGVLAIAGLRLVGLI